MGGEGSMASAIVTRIMYWNFVVRLQDTMNTDFFSILTYYCYGEIEKRSEAAVVAVAWSCNRFSNA